MNHEEKNQPTPAFEPTIWSTVLKAKSDDESMRRAALERLLTRYRPPIIREMQCRRRCSLDDAEDLAHQFIHDCLRRDFLKQVAPEHGRFRTFLKRCIENFLRDEYTRRAALKRGGGTAPDSLDLTDDRGDRLLDPADPAAGPDSAFDRAWARQILEDALIQLERECVSARRGSLFAALKGHLGRATAESSAADIGASLGLSEGAIHVAMHRMRQRLGDLIAEEVRQTVGSQAEWKEELRYLIELIGK